MIYLALPYSGSGFLIAERVRHMTMYDAKLMKQGIFTVSPVYKHLMRHYNEDIPGDWTYWGEYSRQLLAMCKEMHVLCLPGWDESTGVKAEIELAKELGIPIKYVYDL